MEYDPIKRNLNESWKMFENYQNIIDIVIKSQIAMIKSGEITNPVTTVHGRTYRYDGMKWVNVKDENDQWDAMGPANAAATEWAPYNQPQGSVPDGDTAFYDSEDKDKMDEVTRDEHEANMTAALASQGTTSREVGGEEAEMMDYARNWALEHQHEGFDPYDILYLGPGNVAVFNTREPDPETGRAGAYYILGQDIWQGYDLTRQQAGIK